MLTAGVAATGLTPDAILWQEPLSRVGWMVAMHLRGQGVKGIGRKPDMTAVMDRLRAMAEGTEANG